MIDDEQERLADQQRAAQMVEKMKAIEAADPNARQSASQTGALQGSLGMAAYGIQGDVAMSNELSLRAQCLRAALDCSQGVQDASKLIEKAQAFYDFLSGKPRPRVVTGSAQS